MAGKDRSLPSRRVVVIVDVRLCRQEGISVQAIEDCLPAFLVVTAVKVVQQEVVLAPFPCIGIVEIADDVGEISPVVPLGAPDVFIYSELRAVIKPDRWKPIVQGKTVSMACASVADAESETNTHCSDRRQNRNSTCEWNHWRNSYFVERLT